MTRHPRQPLDAEERALAALLPRPHGRGEPGPELDARILAAAQAAAQAAVHPQPASRRTRRSWIAPTAVAASLVLAVGLAWQLRPPPPATEFPAQASDAAAAVHDEAVVRAFETAPAAPEAQDIAMPKPIVAAPPTATPTPTRTADAGARSAPVPAAAAAGAEAAAAPMAAPPPAPPAPPAPVATQDAVAMPQAMEPARSPAQAMAKARANDAAAREQVTVSGSAAARVQQEQAERAANANALDTILIEDDPGEEVPPATADSPDVRDAWLRRIGELLKQGKTEDAKASLAEFKRRYPEATLPPELRKLDP